MTSSKLSCLAPCSPAQLSGLPCVCGPEVCQAGQLCGSEGCGVPCDNPALQPHLNIRQNSSDLKLTGTVNFTCSQGFSIFLGEVRSLTWTVSPPVVASFPLRRVKLPSSQRPATQGRQTPTGWWAGLPLRSSVKIAGPVTSLHLTLTSWLQTLIISKLSPATPSRSSVPPRKKVSSFIFLKRSSFFDQRHHDIFSSPKILNTRE